MEILEKIQAFLIVVVWLLVLWGFLLYVYRAIRRYRMWRVLRARKIAFSKLNHVVIRNNADLEYWLEHGGKNDWLDIQELVFSGSVRIDAEKYGAVWLSYCIQTNVPKE